MSVEAARKQLKSNDSESIQRLIEWLRIPSVSTDPAHREQTRAAGQWVVDQLAELGVDGSLKETGAPDAPGHPIVWAHHPGPKEYTGPHVLFYGHYDVQPPDPLELWDSPPFDPVIKPAIEGGPDERVVARGAVDDKGQVAMFLEALRAWKEGAGEIPIRLTVLIEGEEESGSANLDQFLRDNADELKKADVCLISDTGMLGRGKPAITYGVRGMAYTEIKLHGPDQDLHSGMWGGKVPNPINELCRVLAQLWDEGRRVAIPGFYDDVRDLTQEERDRWKALDVDPVAALKGIGLGPEGDVGEKGYSSIEREWARPTCDINGIWGGYQGVGAKTVIPSFAAAKVSFRLVADQDERKVVERFFKWLNDRTPPGCRWDLKELHGGPPATAETDSDAMRAAVRALEATGAAAPALIKSGGSIPVVGLLKSVLGLDSILMGFGLEDDRIHSPNEKFELPCFRMGALAHTNLIGELQKMG